MKFIKPQHWKTTSLSSHNHQIFSISFKEYLIFPILSKKKSNVLKFPPQYFIMIHLSILITYSPYSRGKSEFCFIYFYLIKNSLKHATLHPFQHFPIPNYLQQSLQSTSSPFNNAKYSFSHQFFHAVPEFTAKFN